jgi:hypothetical protein
VKGSDSEHALRSVSQELTGSVWGNPSWDLGAPDTTQVDKLSSCCWHTTSSARLSPNSEILPTNPIGSYRKFGI